MSVMTRRLVGGITLVGMLVVGPAGSALADESQPDSETVVQDESQLSAEDVAAVVVAADDVVAEDIATEDVAAALDEASQASAAQVADEAAELTSLVPGGLIGLLCGLVSGLPILGDLLAPLLGCPETGAAGGGLLPDLGGLLPDVGGLVPDVGGLVPDVGGVVPEVPAVPAP